MKQLVRESLIDEGYGAGFSMSRMGGMGGLGKNSFGGASNMGGPNMMYTYSIVPLNHTLEQLPTVTNDQALEIQIGSVITGEAVRSNIYPERKIIKGIVHKIETTNNGAIKYYIVQDEATQNNVKIDPLTATLIIAEPVQYYYDATDTTPSRRQERLNVQKKKLVRESIDENI